MKVLACYEVTLSPARMSMTVRGDSIITLPDNDKLTEEVVKTIKTVIANQVNTELEKIGKPRLDESERVLIRSLAVLDG